MRKAYDRASVSDAQRQQAKAALASAGKTVTVEAMDRYLINAEADKRLARSEYGTGGAYTRAMQAATAAVQGIVAGDPGGALISASAPQALGVWREQLKREAETDNAALRAELATAHTPG